MGLFDRWFGGGAKPEDLRPAENEPTPEFPYELIRVRGAEAVNKALAWRNEWRGSFTPLILGTGKNFDLLTEVFDDAKDSPQEIMEQARALDLPGWWEQRLDDSAGLEDVTDESGWNTNAAESGQFHTVADTLSGKIHPWVWVAKVPTAEPYEVPAYLKLGGWNACPNAPEHVAVWCHWQRKYGAEILCVTSDVIEATVARPPQQKEACYALAREQFAYCDDIVTQGVGSIDALAATLRDAKSWFFWWD